jgi:hypothetical protein
MNICNHNLITTTTDNLCCNSTPLPDTKNIDIEISIISSGPL